MADKNLTYTMDHLLADNAKLLYDRAGSATYAAYSRLEWHLDQNFADIRQAAAAGYWQAHARKPLDHYAWTAARYNATNALLHKSVYTVSLDTPDEEDNGPWIENLPATPHHNSAADHWLNHHDLHDLVRHLLARPTDTAVRYNAAILRLLASGYDNAGIAVELGRTESAIKSTRAKLRKRLFTYCRQHGIDTSDIHVQNGGWRPAHHYARMDNTAANAARWHGGNHA